MMLLQGKVMMIFIVRMKHTRIHRPKTLGQGQDQKEGKRHKTHSAFGIYRYETSGLGPEVVDILDSACSRTESLEGQLDIVHSSNFMIL